ncbi:MAG: GGDEF domain-containing response regulator, partial [Verrucomicrobiaceae bacterium]
MNQIIGLSEMLIEIAEEDGRSDLLHGLALLRDGGVAAGSMLEEKRLFPPGVQGIVGFQPLAEAIRAAIGPVLNVSGQLLADEGNLLSGDYRSDLHKIRHAALRFLDLVSCSTLVIPSQPVVAMTSPPSNNNRSFVTRGCPAERRVLIVDDEDLNVEVLCRRLRREGYQPSGVSSGMQALEMLRTGEFDVILLDLVMPGINGIDVLQRLKNDPQLRHIPVIMLSALNDVDRVAQCIELGAEDYLPKPINSTLLRARLGACLEKKQLRDKEQAYFRAMHAEKERLSVTLRSLTDAVITTDASGCITVFNDFGATLASVDRESAVGRPFEEVFRIVSRATGQPVLNPVVEVLKQNRAFDCEPGISMIAADGRE